MNRRDAEVRENQKTFSVAFLDAEETASVAGSAPNFCSSLLCDLCVSAVKFWIALRHRRDGEGRKERP
jgi:hypothetical protein